MSEQRRKSDRTSFNGPGVVYDQAGHTDRRRHVLARQPEVGRAPEMTRFGAPGSKAVN